MLPLCAHAQLVQKTISYENGPRIWFEHVPASYDGSKPVPLVVALHGAYNSGDSFGPSSGWMDVSDANGFIVVFPDGEGTNNSLVWNSWVFNGTAPDDIGFLVQVIAQVKATYRIDAGRVYMTGFSNGGGMTSFFAAAHADLLAAIAPMSAGWITITGLPDSQLHPDAPLPAWVWRGALDDSPTGATPLATQDQQQTAFWAKLDGEGATPQVTTLGTATTSIYTGGIGEVRYTGVSDLGHAVQPGSTARIWTEFFSRFSRVGNTIGNATLPTVSVSVAAPKASAADGVNGSFLLRRDGTPTGALTVSYQMSGTALGGVDYKSLAGTATLPAGAASAKIKVRPKSTGETGKRTVRLSLTPGSDYNLGDPAAAKVKIVD